MSRCPASSRNRKPQAMLRNGVTVLDRIKSRSKCSPSPSLPPSPPPPPESKKAKTRHFPILGLKRGVTGVRVNFQYSFVQYWRQPQSCLHCNVNDQTWTEALTGIGKKCLFKNRHSGMQCQESTWSSFPSSIFTPHIEAGNRSTRTQSQGVRLFLQGKSTQRCLTMIKYTTLTTALWRLLLHTCHFLDYLLNNNSRRKNSIWWKCKRSIRGSGQLHLFAITRVGTRKFKPNHWYQMEVTF